VARPSLVDGVGSEKSYGLHGISSDGVECIDSGGLGVNRKPWYGQFNGH
jgi:hypothetical protein